MTPFEQQLLQTAWPWIWGSISLALPAAIGYYMRQQAKQLAGLAASVASLGDKFAELDKQLIEDRSTMQQKLLKLGSDHGERITALETENRLQHPGGLLRRSSDQRSKWDEDSDLNIAGHGPVSRP